MIFISPAESFSPALPGLLSVIDGLPIGLSPIGLSPGDLSFGLAVGGLLGGVSVFGALSSATASAVVSASAEVIIVSARIFMGNPLGLIGTEAVQSRDLASRE